MRRKYFNLILLVLFVSASISFGQISITSAEEVDVLSKTTVENTVDGIDLGLTYYQGLLVKGFPVSFEIYAYNDTSDLFTWHIDSDITILLDGEKLAYFHGHSHTGVYSFEYLFEEVGSYEISVDLFTSGDTTNWDVTQAWGSRSTSFTVTITDDTPMEIVNGPTTLELKEIDVQFTPTIDGEDIDSASVDDYVDMSFLVTFSNGSTIAHTTAQIIIQDPSDQVVFGSVNVHEHTSNLQMSLKMMQEGIYRIIMYITPTMPGARTQIDYGRQVAVFGLEVGSNTNDAPGLEISLAILGLFVTATVVLRKRANQ